MQSIEEVLLWDPHHIAHRDRDPFPLILFLGGLFAGAFGLALFGPWSWSGVLLAALIAVPIWIGAGLYRRSVVSEPSRRRAGQARDARAAREARIEMRIAAARERGAFREWEEDATSAVRRR